MTNRLANSDTPIDKIVTIQKFETDGKLKILRGYAGGGFQVNDEFISGSIILYPREAHSCPITHDSEISKELLEPHLNSIKPDMVLIGVGENPKHPYQPLRDFAHKQSVGIDIMSTSSACRTWNVLLSEGRKVVACLLAIS